MHLNLFYIAAYSPSDQAAVDRKFRRSAAAVATAAVAVIYVVIVLSEAVEELTKLPGHN